MSLGTAIGRFILFDRVVTGGMTVAHQRRNTFEYRGERDVVVVTNRATREHVRARGNRLYVWGSKAGPGSLVHADVYAPPGQIRFDHLRNGEAFDLFVDRDLFVEGLVVRHRHLVRPTFYIRPFSCDA